MIIVGPDRCSEKTWKPPPRWDKILNLSPFISAKNFKWPPGGTCNKDTTGTSAQLSLAQLGGVFIVLVGGMVCITIIIIIIFLAQHDDVYIINRMVKTPINCNYDCEKEFSLVNCIVTKQHWKRQTSSPRTSWWPGAGDHHCRLRVCVEEEEAACRPKCLLDSQNIFCKLVVFQKATFQSTGSHLHLSQESLLSEMWKELKFAVNWNAGDTKPIRQGRNSSRLTTVIKINNNVKDCPPGPDHGQCWAKAMPSLWTSLVWSEGRSQTRRVLRVGRWNITSGIIWNILLLFSTGFQLRLLWWEFLWRKSEVGLQECDFVFTSRD